jgi:hypothetical protein
MSTELVDDSVDLRAVFLDRVGAILRFGKSLGVDLNCEYNAECSIRSRGLSLSQVFPVVLEVASGVNLESKQTKVPFRARPN